jgi:hypothetical protein
VVTIGECGSHAKMDAQAGPVGGKGSSEQALARACTAAGRGLACARRPRLRNWPDWRAAASTGAALLWRVKSDLRLPVLELLPGGSYASVVARPGLHDKARNKLIAAARAGERLDEDQARTVLRSKSPDMVRQEIYGYLLTHYALSALICRAATEADIDPDRVKFLRTVRVARRRAADPALTLMPASPHLDFGACEDDGEMQAECSSRRNSMC